MRLKVAGYGLVLAGLAFAGLAGATLAQDLPAKPAPVADPLRKISVSAFAGEPTQWPAPPADLIRRAAIKGDPAAWLSEEDAPVKAWLANPSIQNVTLALDVDADGKVAGCAPIARSWERTPAWAADLCPFIVRRTQFIPALRADGSRMADQIIFTANFQFSERIQNRGGPLIESYVPGPAPMQRGDYDPKLQSWPPSNSWIGSVAREPEFKLQVEQPGGPALGRPAIGLVVADPRSGDPECRVVQSSDDPTLDTRACDHARKKLKPAWAETVRFPVRRWPLLLSPEGRGFRAISADPGAIRPLRIEPEEVARLTGLWRAQAQGAKAVRLGGRLGEDGRPADCRIYDSSGNDTADAAACRLFRSEAKFTPAQDAFGQPRKLTGWVSLRLLPQ